MDTTKMTLLLQAAPRPAWYDETLIVLIALTCVLTVMVAAAYPWSFRWLGTGLLAHFAAVGLIFGRGVANLYPEIREHAPPLRADYAETTWTIRVLLIYGSVAVVVGLLVELWHDVHDPKSDLTWRGIARRLVVLVVITGLAWAGLIVVHGWRSNTLHKRDWWLIGLGMVTIVAAALGVWRLWPTLARWAPSQPRGFRRPTPAQVCGVLTQTLPVIVANAAGIIVAVTPPAEALLGTAEAALQGQDLTAIMPRSYHDRHRAGMAHYLATGEGPILGRVVEVEAVRGDGTEVAVSLAVQASEIEGVLYFIGVMWQRDSARVS